MVLKYKKNKLKNTYVVFKDFNKKVQYNLNVIVIHMKKKRFLYNHQKTIQKNQFNKK